jgi:hypothetical protein
MSPGLKGSWVSLEREPKLGGSIGLDQFARALCEHIVRYGVAWSRSSAARFRPALVTAEESLFMELEWRNDGTADIFSGQTEMVSAGLKLCRNQ